MFHRPIAALYLALLLSLPALAQFRVTTAPLPQTAASATTPASAATNATRKQLDVSAATQWTDTGIDLKPGDKISITSEGQLKTFQGPPITPDGKDRSWRDVVRSLPLNTAGTGALIAKIGNDPAVVPFLVGAKKEFAATRPGRLFLGINLGQSEPLEGSFHTTVEFASSDKATTPTAPPIAEARVDADLLGKLPRRVTDKDGGKGDMVNFVMIGPLESVQKAFTAGGWVQVDRTSSDAVVHAVLATMQKKSYLEMPMSELYLFGRPQDFGFARAEPLAVVEQRHHLRIWKAPFQSNGQDVWVGAATHDLGFEKDQRNGNVTHRIDPNVDEERDFVRASLTEGGGVTANGYTKPKDAVQQASTATGGSFHSDGRVLVLQLR